jgi:AbrB family looped-hinge helix DNA binding protein
VPLMKTKLKIDSAGRIVLPKALRTKLGLGPGDMLELENVGERVMLRPMRCDAPLVQEKGVWVLCTGRPMAASVTDKILQETRNQRDKQNSAAPR